MSLYNYVVTPLKRYATISVPIKVKRILEEAKGKDEWGKFLLELYTELEILRSKRAFEKLAETLTDEDLKVIIESSKEFRRRLTLR